MRIIRSIISLFIVVAIVFVLIYKYIPKDNIFVVDSVVVKYKGDNKTDYKYKTWERYGYLDYVTMGDYCGSQYSGENVTTCATAGAANDSYKQDFIDTYTDLGYTIEIRQDGNPFAYKNNNTISMFFKWVGKVLHFDHKNRVQDENINDADRKVYLGKDWNGVPAVMCYGCEHKYLFWIDGKFPFIHSNWLTINLGTSYPTYSGMPIVGVITDRQGAQVEKEITFPTGMVDDSSILEHTCQYNSYVDSFNKRYFDDNYITCENKKADGSMVGTSFLIGILSSILAYILGVPLGMLMARYKNKWFDKLGMLYIIFITSVPSLAYIFMFSRIGSGLFKLPLKFAFYGAHNPLSYILPIVSLALPSVAGLMMWIRRYMLDQSQSDYVKFARAKGLSESEIMNTHIMRNAIIPIVHGIPMDICLALVGAIITERVYAVPGMGKMLTDAINSYNNSMIVALTFIFTGLSIIGLIAGDLLMGLVDPRISFDTKGGRK